MMQTALRHLRSAGLYDGPDADYVMIRCPFAKWLHGGTGDSKPSMKINVYEGTVRYYCFGCKEHGPLWMMFGLLSNLTGESRFQVHADECRKELEPSVETRLALAGDRITVPQRVRLPGQAFQRWWDSFPDMYTEMPERVQLFMKKRGVNPDMAVFCDLKYDHMADRLMFPSFRSFGSDELVSVTGRALTDSSKPYFVYWKTRSTDFLGYSRVLPPQDCEAFLLVEGFMDVLRTLSNLLVLEMDDVFCPVCSFTSALSDNQASLIEFEQLPVYCMYDADRAGDDGWNKVMRKLRDRVPGIQRLRPPDGGDPGQMDATQLGELLLKTERRITLI